MSSPVDIVYQGRLAIITINNEKKLNALTQDGYYELAKLMREAATHDEVYITVLTGKGSFFSAGADVAAQKFRADDALQTFVVNNLNITQAFYAHPKILITALNGPVVGLSAALVSFSDFIYCTPHTFLLTPFSSLGLVTEGGSSRSFVQRLGISKANEALIMSKRISAEELLQVGFVNKIFDCKQGDNNSFRDLVLKEIDDRLGSNLVGDSLTKIKALIRKPDREAMDTQNVAEVIGGLERFMSGIPQEQFRILANGEKKHKL